MSVAAPAPVPAPVHLPPAGPGRATRATRDLATMSGRSLLRMVRYPSLTVLIVVTPV